MTSSSSQSWISGDNTVIDNTKVLDNVTYRALVSGGMRVDSGQELTQRIEPWIERLNAEPIIHRWS